MLSRHFASSECVVGDSDTTPFSGNFRIGRKSTGTQEREAKTREEHAGIYTGTQILDNSSVTFFEYFYSPRAKGRFRSWWSLTFTFPLVLTLVHGLYYSRRDAAIGTRQESTSGQITAYEPSNHNSCRYTFTVQEKQYVGMDSSPTATPVAPAIVGDQIQVYFDPINPTTNSLEDFSIRSHRVRGLVPISAFGICVIPAIILYLKLTGPSKNVT